MPIPFTAKDGSKEAIFAIVPVQPLDEVTLINDYMVYIFRRAFICNGTLYILQDGFKAPC